MQKIKKICFPDSDAHFLDRIDGDGFYQRAQFTKSVSYISKPRVFIDIGAHVGLWSRQAILHGFGAAYCFEPCEENYICLVNNMSKYPVATFMVAIGKQGTCKVVSDCADNSGAMHIESDGSVYIDSLTKFIGCPVAFKERYGLLGNDCLMKIDVEGTELDVIEACRDFIMEIRPIICIEQRKDRIACDKLIEWGMVELKRVHCDYIMGWA